MMHFAIALAATAAVSFSLAACGPSAPPPAQPAPGDSAAWGPPGSPTSPPPAGYEEHGEEAPYPEEAGAPPETGAAYPAPEERPTRPDRRPEPARPEPARPEPARPEPARPEPPGPDADPPPASRDKPAAADSMAELERGIAEEMNRMRRNPKAWAATLQRWRGYYDGRLLRVPGGDMPIQTFEGVAAVDEAIAAARASKPLPEFRVSPGLGRAARDHAKELGAAGTLDHFGKNGSSPFDRMKRHGRLDGQAGENIGTAMHGSGEFVVIDLFVDDGVEGRGHRKNLLSPRYHVVGVGCAPHKAYDTICVIDYAEAFEDR